MPKCPRALLAVIIRPLGTALKAKVGLPDRPLQHGALFLPGGRPGPARRRLRRGQGGRGHCRHDRATDGVTVPQSKAAAADVAITNVWNQGKARRNASPAVFAGDAESIQRHATQQQGRVQDGQRQHQGVDPSVRQVAVSDQRSHGPARPSALAPEIALRLSLAAPALARGVRRAAWLAAMSIFLTCLIASTARPAFLPPPGRPARPTTTWCTDEKTSGHRWDFPGKWARAVPALTESGVKRRRACMDRVTW